MAPGWWSRSPDWAGISGRRCAAGGAVPALDLVPRWCGRALPGRGLAEFGELPQRGTDGGGCGRAEAPLREVGELTQRRRGDGPERLRSVGQEHQRGAAVVRASYLCNGYLTKTGLAI